MSSILILAGIFFSKNIAALRFFYSSISEYMPQTLVNTPFRSVGLGVISSSPYSALPESKILFMS